MRGRTHGRPVVFGRYDTPQRPSGTYSRLLFLCPQAPKIMQVAPQSGMSHRSRSRFFEPAMPSIIIASLSGMAMEKVSSLNPDTREVDKA